MNPCSVTLKRNYAPSNVRFGSFPSLPSLNQLPLLSSQYSLDSKITGIIFLGIPFYVDTLTVNRV